VLAHGTARESGGARLDVSEIDAYAVLGVARNATDGEVRAAWRVLVREHHPDAMTARGADEAAVEVQPADRSDQRRLGPRQARQEALRFVPLAIPLAISPA
jgi:hypothetical protein